MKSCRLCDRGFPLNSTGDYHLPSQRKGMIPRTLCRKKESPVGPTLSALGISKVSGRYVYQRADGTTEILTRREESKR